MILLNNCVFFHTICSNCNSIISPCFLNTFTSIHLQKKLIFIHQYSKEYIYEFCELVFLASSPSQPISVSAVATSDSIVVSWKAPLQNADLVVHYKIQYRVKNSTDDYKYVSLGYTHVNMSYTHANMSYFQQLSALEVLRTSSRVSM